jgi:CheY-like chemotaxis protein
MRNVRVLLVDDDEDYTAFIKRLLARHGGVAQPDVVHDEQAALKALQAHEYDVVVSDYELHPGNGLRILQEVRRLRPKAQRILLTSAPEKALKQLPHGDPLAHGVWDKRWEMTTLREHLSTLLAGVA